MQIATVDNSKTKYTERAAQAGIGRKENQMKRNLFNELKEGLSALASEREGKITLRQHVVEKNLLPLLLRKTC